MSLLKVNRLMLSTLMLMIVLALIPAKSCSAAKHCYATNDVNVLDVHKNIVGVIKKGTTFSYKKKRRGWIQFKYYGKVRYASCSNLITNKRLKSFVNDNPNLFSQQIRVSRKCKVLNSSGSKVLYNSKKNESFKIFGQYQDYYHVKVDGKEGLLKKNAGDPFYYVEVTEFTSVIGNTERDRVVNYAKKFVGNPYVWGGESLTSGCDCSGFTMLIMRKFGVTLPHYSGSQAKCGKPVSKKEAKPGDLLFFLRGNRIGHVAIYAGNGKMVEAKGRQWGIVVSDVNLDSVYCVRNVLN